MSNREIRLLRYLNLTEEEKLRGSYKVARKLEKLESAGQDKDMKSDDDDDEENGFNGGEQANIDGCTIGKISPSDASGDIIEPRTSNSGPPSVREPMRLMNEILSDGRMDRLEKIEKLESILAATTSGSLVSRSQQTSSSINTRLSSIEEQ